jgi:hypothetical protein
MPKTPGTATVYCVLLLLGLTVGCRTTPLPPVDFHEPGWAIRQGQAVWKPHATAPELAGELTLAQHPDGRTAIEFTKTPFPLVTAQVTPKRWQIEFPSENKKFSAPGTPPARLGWLHLVNAIRGTATPEPWRSSRIEPDHWMLQNPRTGESIEVVLEPAPQEKPPASR